VSGRVLVSSLIRSSFRLEIAGRGPKRACQGSANWSVRVSYFMYLSVKVQGLFEWSKIGGCLL
jgi:hypothetical protein